MLPLAVQSFRTRKPYEWFGERPVRVKGGAADDAVKLYIASE